MRQIRFRAWNTHFKEMWAHFQVDGDTGAVVLEDENGDTQHHQPDSMNLILMQFTGLHDKNGKEIWEGDVVWISETTRAVIKYFGAGFDAESLTETYGDKPKTYGWNAIKDSCLVLGNIYENPELLG